MTAEAAGPLARPDHMGGLEHLEAIRDGRFPGPPIAELLGFELVEVGHGRATFAVEPGEQHYNPIGVVHGGIAATLLDSAMGCAVQTTLEAGVGYTTLDLNVIFPRPMTVAPNLARSMQLLAPTSTSSSRITIPICGMRR